jgi:hypothetical protein
MIWELCQLSPRLACATLLLFAGQVGAASITLEDALASTLRRAPETEDGQLPAASDWLAGVPTVSASYIDSRQALGTDELEVSLNLPIKSAGRRRLDRELENLKDHYASAIHNYRRWIYSGLIRERAWGHRLAEVDLAAAEDKQALLTELAERFDRLAASGAIPRYSSLIVERARLDAEMAVDAARLDVERERDAFIALTGLASVPGDLSESAPVPSAPNYSQHPALQRMELARDREAAVLALSAPDKASWNLSLVARNFDGPQFNEQQIGLAVEAPLNFLGTQSSSNRSQRSAAQLDYLLARDQFWLEVRNRWQALAVERSHLQRRRELLERAATVADQIEAQVSALESSNEIEGEIRLQRMLDVLDTRASLARTEALIERNVAQRHQAAGGSL